MLWLFTKIKLKKYDVVKSKGERIRTIIYSRITRNISCFGKSKRLCDVCAHVGKIQLVEAACVSRGSNRDSGRRKISVSN